MTPAALPRRYDELLHWTRKKHLVVIPTFEAQDMQLAYQTATGGRPALIWREGCFEFVAVHLQAPCTWPACC